MSDPSDAFREAPPDLKRGMRGHLRIESGRQLLLKPDLPVQWLIESIWTDKSRGIIAGNPGVGKTWLALDMLIAVCTGLLCLDHYAVKKSPVLLIEEEASEQNLSRRVRAMVKGRGLKETDMDDFYHITRQYARIPRDTDEIISIILANRIKFIVFDSMRRFHTAKENSADEMQPILDSFAKISDKGVCSVAIIHHLSKSNGDGGKKPIFERMRGTSDLWAWRDCLIGMEGEEEAEEAHCSFQFRDAESTSPILVKRVLDPLTSHITMTAIPMEYHPETEEKIDLIYNYCKSQYGAISKNKICENVGGKKQELLRIIKIMTKRGMLKKDGSGLVPVSGEPAGTAGTGVDS